MASDYSSFFSSPPFSVEGPGGRSFWVHSPLIAKHLKVFNKAVAIDMKEQQTNKFEIWALDSDIDDDTVARFVEYAYTGDYTVTIGNEEVNDSGIDSKTEASRSAKSADQNGTDDTFNFHEDPMLGFDPELAPEPEYEHEMAVQSNSTRKKKKMKYAMKPCYDRDWAVDQAEYDTTLHRYQQNITVAQTNQSLWSKFISKATTKPFVPWEPRKVDSQPENVANDYTIDLLCHAQLYVFSNRYDCRDLAELALQKLRLTLSRYNLGNGVMPVIQLSGYTYAHTHDYDTGRDKLRQLVIDSLVCHLEKIVKEPEFKRLLREEGYFADDLLTGATKRLEMEGSNNTNNRTPLQLEREQGMTRLAKNLRALEHHS